MARSIASQTIPETNGTIQYCRPNMVVPVAVRMSREGLPAKEASRVRERQGFQNAAGSYEGSKFAGMKKTNREQALGSEIVRSRSRSSMEGKGAVMGRDCVVLMGSVGLSARMWSYVMNPPCPGRRQSQQGQTRLTKKAGATTSIVNLRSPVTPTSGHLYYPGIPEGRGRIRGP